MDSRTYVRRRIEETTPEMAWQPGSKSEMQEWQIRLRNRLSMLVGLPTGKDWPLSSFVDRVEQMRGYRREMIRFESRPGLEVFAYFLVPDNCPSGQPAVLCLPGHGRGVDSIVGIAEDGSQRDMDSPAEYQADFALQCVSQGCCALAIEQVSFGRRRDEIARNEGPEASSCHRDTAAAFMLGESMVGWRVWDAIRAIDYLHSRTEVDPKRIATMGISGGGVTSLWTACLDPRVAACIVSGYFNTFADSILSIHHCIDNYVPGLSGVVEMPDLAGLVAPRPLFVEGGDRDPIFPLHTLQKAITQATEIYSAWGVPGRFGSEVFEGDHQFHGVGAFRFLKAALP